MIMSYTHNAKIKFDKFVIKGKDILQFDYYSSTVLIIILWT